MSDIKRYQIVESFGGGCYAYQYFDHELTDPDDLNPIVRKMVWDSWERNNRLSLFGARMPRPTVSVREYDTTRHQKKRNGIAFKMRWR